MAEELHYEEFSSLIAAIHGDMQKLKARCTARLGFKSVHVFWIYLLNTHPEGLSASQLARAGGASRSLVSREMHELFEQGIVYTVEGGERRRYGWKLQLTEKGRRLAGVITAVAGQVQRRVSRGIPPAQLTDFYRTLRTLAGEFHTLAADEQLEEEMNQWLGK